MTQISQAANRLDPEENASRIRDALKDICESDLFVNAERLKSFLTYVVEETVEGRGNGILGKTIAQDVYFRKSTGAASRDNVVRVDAGRLRRKLEEYYAVADVDHDLKIHIDSGGYTPWFEDRSDGTQRQTFETDAQGVTRKWMLGAGSLIVAIAAAGLVFFWGGWPSTTTEQAGNSELRMLEKQALATRSPATVQASNYCEQARGLLFPVASIDNQKLASGIFRQAIKEAPNFVCGYAGLGHSLATQTLLTPPGEQRDALVSEAMAMAKRAIELAPTYGWSHSATAWAAFANLDYDKTLKHSAMAESLGPTDGNVLDFRGVTLLLIGDVQEAFVVTDADRPREFGSHKFAHRNIHAVASFHLGKYDTVLQSLKFANDGGDPVSALSLVYEAASYQGLGETRKAQAKLRQLKESWPDFIPERVLYAFYPDAEMANEVLAMLRLAGWEALGNSD